LDPSSVIVHPVDLDPHAQAVSTLVLIVIMDLTLVLTLVIPDQNL